MCMPDSSVFYRFAADVNADLADSFGNLANRLLSFAATQIARALCDCSSSLARADNERRLMQAWNAYADHVGLPKAARPDPAQPAP